MDRETQLGLLDRIQAHRKAGQGTDEAEDFHRQPVTAYTSVERQQAELALMRRIPTIVGLSDLLPEPNTYASTTVGEAPVVLTRDKDARSTHY